jgi:hypothetical protein
MVDALEAPLATVLVAPTYGSQINVACQLPRREDALQTTRLYERPLLVVSAGNIGMCIKSSRDEMAA